MKYNVKWTPHFKKDYKLCINRGFDIKLLDEAIDILANTQKLPSKYKDHQLTGEWKDFRECHIKPDWLLVYSVQNNTLTLSLSRTGTHSDIF